MSLNSQIKTKSISALFVFLLFPAAMCPAQYVLQSKRNIPIVKKADVLVVGGSTYAVSAAVSASQKGAGVFLAAPFLYLGEDICATLRLDLSLESALTKDFAKEVFGHQNKPTPAIIKKMLNQSLIDAGVDFVLGSFLTDVILDENNEPAGVIIANRAGRQAIISKVIIDATDHASVCRLIGAKSCQWTGNEVDFERTIVMPSDEPDQVSYIRKDLSIPMKDMSFRAFAAAEQTARTRTYIEGQLRSSERLFYVPPDPIVCKKNFDNYENAASFDPDYFRPADFDYIYILSGCADIPREKAGKLLEPGVLCETGIKIGLDACNTARKRDMPSGLTVKTNLKKHLEADVKEVLTGLRPTDKDLETLECPQTAIEIAAYYDIVVVGGGTTGAPAAIAAARQGDSVLVVEYQYGLGGIGTLGLIGKPCSGKLIGFSKEVPFPDENHNIEYKMEWYRREIIDAGGDIWFGVIGCGAIVRGDSVKGVILATEHGRFAVSAKVVIDATGNGDIAIAAGADYMYGEVEKNHIAMQGAGFPPRPLHADYVNSDYLLVDESDMVNLTASLAGAQQAMGTDSFKRVDLLYDIATMVQTRERRRVIGDHILRYVDQIAGRTYPDSIVHSESGYDSHGYPVSPVFALLPHNEKSRKETHPAPGGSCYTPYRCLLPRELEDILVVGLGMSMVRDASAAVRMQYDMSNQGYAAGLAASLAVKQNVSPRNIDIKVLQKQLIDTGNLPEEVLTHSDSFPLSEDIVRRAVVDYGNAEYSKDAGRPLCILYTHSDTALPIVLKHYREAEGRIKLQYAKLLGIWGVAEVLPVLLEDLNQVTEWDERILQGVMAEYAHLPTPIDASILAAGYIRDRAATGPVLRLLEMLDAEVTLSHHRAVALALEKLADPTAAKPLADLLQKPDMSGHVLKGIQPLPNIPVESRKREGALREIVIARALYACGDYQGIARHILNEYRDDVRGLFARHADRILNK
jgi:hypothetical protein